MTDIRILSCPQCGFPKIRDCGNGLYQCDDCGTHFDKDENIVLTEQEWLQTCTTEQLIEFLEKITDPRVGYLVGYWEMWLKQPHKPIS